LSTMQGENVESLLEWKNKPQIEDQKLANLLRK
jgi:hypothetical protein